MVDDLEFDDYWMLNAFACDYPPVDLLVAAYMGHKPGGAGSTVSRREAMRTNAKALQSVPLPRTGKTLDQMPAFLRSPEMMATIESMKAAQAG